MDERVLIKGEKRKSSRGGVMLCLVIVEIIFVVCYLIVEYREKIFYASLYNGYDRWNSWTSTLASRSGFKGFIRFMFLRPVLGVNVVLGPIVLAILVIIIVMGIRRLVWRKVELVVTDKRIYGVTVFGKRVDLPLDSVSSVGSGRLRRLTVATSSGTVKFNMLKNRDAVHKALSDLLIDRQRSAEVVKPSVQASPSRQSDADELKKFKELLDSGVISQEEFDQKKKQLLGL